MAVRPNRRAIAVAATFAVLATVVVDHLAGPGDDGSRYDHRSFMVAGISAGDVLRLGDGTSVRLLGIADPAPGAAASLARSVLGRAVTLLLPTVGTRDPAGRLLAYVYADDGACLNVALVHDGLAYADRRGTDVMAGLIDAAENDARRKRRGMWDGLAFDQMPAWRQAWLRGRATPRR